MDNNNQTLSIISGVSIRNDDEGRYCLNDIAAAAKKNGVTKDITPKEWLTLKSTKNLQEILNRENPLFEPIRVKEGRYGGTYVHEDLVLAYATWVDSEFYLLVLRTFKDQMNKQNTTSPMDEYNQLVIDEAVRKKLGSVLGRGLRQCGIQKLENKTKSKEIMRRLQTELMLDFVAPVKMIGKEVK